VEEEEEKERQDSAFLIFQGEDRSLTLLLLQQKK
jgi:hypothetical protein